MTKIRPFLFFIFYFAFVFLILLLVNIFLFSFKYLAVINIVLSLIFVALTFYLILCFYVRPIKSLVKLTTYYNEGNYAYKNYDLGGKDTLKLTKNLEELGQNYSQINQKYQELDQENQSYYEQYVLDLENKKQLVASISHEIKTPLAVIEATASALYDDIIPEESFKEELNNIITECDKTSQMLQEIVNIYKIDSKNEVLEKKETNLKDIIDEVIKEYQNLIIKYQKEVIITSDLNLTYNLNYNQFKKAIRNIFLNALIYSPLKEKITITLKTYDDYKALEITNYGVTIDKNDLKRLFEPFYRVDKSRTKKEDHGNGLGLYIVKEILDKHNLDFGIKNVTNGVTFYILFPTKDLN